MYDITHATPELFAALAKAQGEIENASKNAANPHFKSKYADLAEVLNTIRPTFATNGLSMIQSYWLRRAFDRYVTEGADLELELADAEELTLAYLECTQSVTVDVSATGGEQMGRQFELIGQCATSVDPTFSMGG